MGARSSKLAANSRASSRIAKARSRIASKLAPTTDSRASSLPQRIPSFIREQAPTTVREQARSNREQVSTNSKQARSKRLLQIALITGITGQDGAYLAEFLLDKGYVVHGIKRRTSLFNTDRIDHLYQDPHETNRRFILHHGDLTDSSNLVRIIQQVQPDEIYNLAAQSHVAVSFEEPEYTANSDALGTLRLLEAIRILGLERKPASTRPPPPKLYGLVQETPQKETTPFYPRSPYGVAKLYAYWITVNYREAYGIYACNGILFNHESPVRGETFVTRKITRALWRASSSACRTASTSAISTPGATGAMRATTSRCSG